MSMLIIHSQVNDSYCGSLQLSVLGTDCISEALGNGYIVKGYAEFDGPYLKGRIRLVSGHADLLQNIEVRVGDKCTIYVHNNYVIVQT